MMNVYKQTSDKQQYKGILELCSESGKTKSNPRIIMEEQAFFFDSVHTAQNNHWNIFKYKIILKQEPLKTGFLSEGRKLLTNK